MTEMTETSFKGTVGTARSTRHALLTLVREACDMLLLAHPSVVGSITVSRTLDDGDGAALVRTMALRLAEEYGVDADARTDGSTVIVRLARDAGHIHVERNNGRHNGARHDGRRGA
jgi:hypothetical protein